MTPLFIDFINFFNIEYVFDTPPSHTYLYFKHMCNESIFSTSCNFFLILEILLWMLLDFDTDMCYG